MSEPTLFDIQPTITRRNDSYHSLQLIPEREKLERVKKAFRMFGGLTSRQLSECTKIERTTITRILKENEVLFDTNGSIYDSQTNRTVTLYRMK